MVTTRVLFSASKCLLSIPVISFHGQWILGDCDLPATGPTGLRISKRALRGLWRGPLRTSGTVPRERRTARDNLEVEQLMGGWGALSLTRCGDAEMAHVNRGLTTTTNEWTRRGKRRRAAGSCEPLPTGAESRHPGSVNRDRLHQEGGQRRAQRRIAAGSCEPLPEKTTRISEADARKGVPACAVSGALPRRGASTRDDTMCCSEARSGRQGTLGVVRTGLVCTGS